MMLPMLDLRTRGGAVFSWLPLWQRRNLLVLVSDGCPACRRVLADWNEQAEALRAENTCALAVFDADPGEDFPGVTVLVDPDRRLARQVGAAPGTVLAVDRFFEVLQTEDAHAMGADPAVADALGWVWLAERRCPECGVGTW